MFSELEVQFDHRQNAGVSDQQNRLGRSDHRGFIQDVLAIQIVL